MDQELLNNIGDIESVVNSLKAAFVAKDDLIEIMAICAISHENILIVGPPGTAKSEIAKYFALLCSPKSKDYNGNIPYFEYLFTRFTEPSEIFGPVDIKSLRKGEGHKRMTNGMLPHAEMTFLDEIFKANSAILNALLTILNERIFYNGGKAVQVPLICCIGATNDIPDDPTLAALFDRFLVRMWSDNVLESRFNELFEKGWEFEKNRIREEDSKKIATMEKNAIRKIYTAIQDVDLSDIKEKYREVIRRIRAEGIVVSDRRVIKLLKLISASALRNRRKKAYTGDFWILKHIWNKPEQIPHLQTIIEPYLIDYKGVQYSAEIDIEKIQAGINSLEAEKNELKTDADYASFIQKAEQYRRILMSHSKTDEEKAKSLIKKLEELINQTMKMLEILE